MSLSPALSKGAALAMPAHHSARDTDTARSAKSMVACDRCRLKKIKCDASQPCKSCFNSAVDCHYTCVSRRRRGPARTKVRPQSLKERLNHAERLLREAGLSISDLPPLVASTVPLASSNPNSGAADASAPVATPATAAASACSPAHTQYLLSPQGARAAAHPPLDFTATPTFNVDLNAFPSLLTPSETSNCADPPELPPPAQGRDLLGAYSTTTSTAPASVTIAKPGTGDENRGVDEPVNELLGPNSFLSICLDPGMGWIASRIHASSFRTSAPSMLSAISNKLQLNERLATDRVPDPDEATAWTYVRAYFDESLDATFCFVDRSSFEARLRNHFDNPIRMDDDPAWYATRNTVYAIGCKIHTFKTRSWTEAQEESKTYFKNALAVESDLLHGGGLGLTSIQALFLMAIYAESCGSPKIEYMLIGCALRLSHAKGLHLRPSPSGLAQADVQKRSWLFWSIYCFEKHLAMRVGGPSIIDDDNISCDLPTWVPGVSPNIVEFLNQSIQQANISSDILKKFTTVKAQQLTPLQKMKLVKDMDERLKNWYDELPQHFKRTFHAPSSQMPEGLRIEHLMYLNFTYHANMSAIHSIFGYPWSILTSQNMSHTAIQGQAAASAKVLAQSSRAIILAIRSISIDSVAPVWFVFYYPLIGMINTFISVLSAPEVESKVEGIGLLEMAAGHFAYLEYATQSAVSIPGIRSLAHWAREAVSKNLSAVTPREQSDNPVSHEQMASSCQQYNDAELPYEIYDFAADPFTAGQWLAFLPRLPQVDSYF